jgi:Zn-dependent protease
MLKILAALLAAGKLGKVLTTALTMVLSVGVYALVFGWGYAVGIVALLFCHEMGHYLAARQRGLAVGAPTFIPFLGAWIELKDQPMDVETEAHVALAGPVAGTLSAILCLLAARATDETLLLALAYSGFLLNLVNLLPISPLDGGRITAILSPRVWLAGVPMLGLLFWAWPSPMLLIVVLLAAPYVWRAIRFDPNAPENVRYYQSTLRQKLEYGAWYLGLAAFLAVMTFELHEELQALVPVKGL